MKKKKLMDLNVNDVCGGLAVILLMKYKECIYLMKKYTVHYCRNLSLPWL